RAKLDILDRMHRSKIADCKYDRGEQKQPWNETREDRAWCPQEQKGPNQPADETQNEQAQDADFADGEDVAAIRPSARKCSGKQRDDTRRVRIDGIKTSEQKGWKCHQGSAAGERVQGSAEERRGDENDGGHECDMCRLRWEAGDCITVARRYAG